MHQHLMSFVFYRRLKITLKACKAPLGGRKSLCNSTQSAADIKNMDMLLSILLVTVTVASFGDGIQFPLLTDKCDRKVLSGCLSSIKDAVADPKFLTAASDEVLTQVCR